MYALIAVSILETATNFFHPGAFNILEASPQL